MKRSCRTHLSLCLSMILLFSSLLSLPACRNRDFTPASPPSDPQGGDTLPADFQCWVRTPDGEEYRLPADTAADLFDEVKRIYKKSDSIEAFPNRDGGIRLVFCTGGTAPEAIIPAYQLPNAVLYGVYTLFPDDTGRYGENIVTAHVHSFRLRKGSYERVTELASPIPEP